MVDICYLTLNIGYDGKTVYRWYYTDSWERYSMESFIENTRMTMRHHLNERIQDPNESKSKVNKYTRLWKALSNQELVKSIAEGWLEKVKDINFDPTIPPEVDFTTKDSDDEDNLSHSSIYVSGVQEESDYGPVNIKEANRKIE